MSDTDQAAPTTEPAPAAEIPAAEPSVPTDAAPDAATTGGESSAAEPAVTEMPMPACGMCAVREIREYGDYLFRDPAPSSAEPDVSTTWRDGIRASDREAQRLFDELDAEIYDALQASNARLHQHFTDYCAVPAPLAALPVAEFVA